MHARVQIDKNTKTKQKLKQIFVLFEIISNWLFAMQCLA